MTHNFGLIDDSGNIVVRLLQMEKHQLESFQQVKMNKKMDLAQKWSLKSEKRKCRGKSLETTQLYRGIRRNILWPTP